MAKRQRVGVLVTKKIGNWDKTIQTLKAVNIDIIETVKKSKLDLAKKLKNALVDHILSQDLNWEPLAAETIKRKNQKNKGMIYMDTETYINAISIVRNGKDVSVGIKKGQPYKGRKDRSVTVDQVAMWMEYGTRRAPKRPLWQPTIDEFGGAKGFRDKIASDIYKRVQQLTKGTAINIDYKTIRNII